jgi:hypothetical protein
MLSNTASTTNDDPHRPQGHHVPIPFLDANGPSWSYSDGGNSYSNSDMQVLAMPNAVITEIDCSQQ